MAACKGHEFSLICNFVGASAMTDTPLHGFEDVPYFEAQHDTVSSTISVGHVAWFVKCSQSPDRRSMQFYVLSPKKDDHLCVLTVRYP